jgi:hypothetical protein
MKSMARDVSVIAVCCGMIFTISSIDAGTLAHQVDTTEFHPIFAERIYRSHWYEWSQFCYAGQAHAGRDLQIDNLTNSIVTIESWARGPFERAVEIGVVKLFLKLGIDPPDLSIGIAQMRISTARKTVKALYASEISDIEIVSSLADTCEAYELARNHIQQISGVHDLHFDRSNDRVAIADIYSSGETKMTHEFSYGGVVEEVYLLHTSDSKLK